MRLVCYLVLFLLRECLMHRTVLVQHFLELLETRSPILNKIRALVFFISGVIDARVTKEFVEDSLHVESVNWVQHERLVQRVRWMIRSIGVRDLVHFDTQHQNQRSIPNDTHNI